MADIPSSRLASTQFSGGAIKLNGLQNGWQFSSSVAYPGDTTVVYSITTTLAEALSVNVPSGKQMVLDLLYVPSGLSTSQLLTVEVEVDGSTVVSGTVTPSTSQITFIGATSGDGSNRIIVNSNFKLRIRTATTTQSNINFRYRYYLI